MRETTAQAIGPLSKLRSALAAAAPPAAVPVTTRALAPPSTPAACAVPARAAPVAVASSSSCPAEEALLRAFLGTLGLDRFCDGLARCGVRTRQDLLACPLERLKEMRDPAAAPNGARLFSIGPLSKIRNALDDLRQQTPAAPLQPQHATAVRQPPAQQPAPQPAAPRAPQPPSADLVAFLRAVLADLTQPGHIERIATAMAQRGAHTRAALEVSFLSPSQWTQIDLVTRVPFFFLLSFSSDCVYTRSAA